MWVLQNWGLKDDIYLKTKILNFATKRSNVKIRLDLDGFEDEEDCFSCNIELNYDSG
jgi:hypothetical protein